MTQQDHNQKHHSHNHNHSSENLRIAFIINFAFTIIEIIGGLYTNSIAILSDAVHDLGDTISLGMSAFLERVSKKAPDDKYTFGYQRFSLLGAVISSMVLFGGTIFILTETIPRLLNPQIVDAKGMLLFSILGIVFNGFAYFKTHGGSSLNEKTISLHLLEDLFGWVAILIGSVVLLFVDWYMIDSLMSISISIFILYHVYRNMKEILAIFLQKTPAHINVKQIKKELETLQGVDSAHHLHIWSLSDMELMMSVNILVRKDAKIEEIYDIKQSIRKHLEQYHLHHVTIEIECIRQDNGNCTQI
jgi:cobalt-zinc-cadmium efflux system protein